VNASSFPSFGREVEEACKPFLEVKASPWVNE